MEKQRVFCILLTILAAFPGTLLATDDTSLCVRRISCTEEVAEEGPAAARYVAFCHEMRYVRR